MGIPTGSVSARPDLPLIEDIAALYCQTLENARINWKGGIDMVSCIANLHCSRN